MRAQAEHGPWLSRWMVSESDAGYSPGIASLGISSVAYVPRTQRGRILGLVAAGVGDAEGGQSAITEYLPAPAEFADTAAAALAPGLASFGQRSSAMQVIDRILEERRFRPVFQPASDLARGRTVGFEALTRFDAPLGTEQIFFQAGLMGRLRELELATLRAAIAAAAALPASCWVSFNLSPELMADADTLAALLEPVPRRLILELSEHHAIDDYEPIGRSLARLGPGRSLAVDDAGAGFASLRHILEVRPAYVKLDLGLVRGVSTDLTRRALVAGLVQFARDAEFTLIAEESRARPTTTRCATWAWSWARATSWLDRCVPASTRRPAVDSQSA